MKLKLILTSCAMILSSIGTRAVSFNAETQAWLTKLDEVVAQREEINQQKRAKLSAMRMAGSSLATLEDVYAHNSKIYDECFTFDSELAMEVADANLSIARQLKDEEKEMEWVLNKAFILASTGQLLEAANTIEVLNPEKLSRPLRLKYYDQMQYLYSHLSQYSWNKPLKEQYDKQGQAYNDSIFPLLQTEDKDYLWFHTWQLIYSDLEEAIAELKPICDTMDLTTRDQAKLCYALARAYDLKEDRENFVQYMCRSGIADLNAANQDIGSIEEMAMVLYEEGDLARAYTYINVCLETARIYNNLVRTVSIAPKMDQILASYAERDAEQRSRTRMLLVFLSVGSILLVAGILISWRLRINVSRQRTQLRESNNQLQESQQQLAEANRNLKEANLRLHESMLLQESANKELKEANFVKEEYIGYVFSLCSSYISKMDEYRKLINRKAKVKQFDEILEMSGKATLVQDELKEFYQNFDALFLNVYPHFIEDFNALLEPEERIEPRKGELLNTDLRIYALVRLGISDSVKIAEFLHVSPQTVYNNRLKIRNKALVAKEEFTDHVRQLGRASENS